MTINVKTASASKAELQFDEAMDSKHYEIFRTAILEVVPASGDGLPESELAVLVRERLPAGKLENLGSITWHVNAVLSDLAKNGIIERRTNGDSSRLVRHSEQAIQRCHRF